MQIRRLTIDELPLTYSIGRAFAKEANFPGRFNSEAFARHWKPLMKAGIGEIMATIADESDVASELIGVMGYAFAECPFSGAITALESFWWVHPDHRKGRVGALMWEAFEARAKERDAARICMIHLAGLDLSKVYEARGYKLCEQTFWKEI